MFESKHEDSDYHIGNIRKSQVIQSEKSDRMSLDMLNTRVKEFLEEKGFGDRLTEHAETIDTVEHAAQQIGCTESEIAKMLSFIVQG